MSRPISLVLIAVVSLALASCAPPRRGGGGGGGGGARGAAGGGGAPANDGAGGGGADAVEGEGEADEGAAADGGAEGNDGEGADAAGGDGGEDGGEGGGEAPPIDPGVDPVDPGEGEGGGQGGEGEGDGGAEGGGESGGEDGGEGNDGGGEPAGCTYPEHGLVARGGAVMPRLKWDAAFDMDGNEVELDLQDIHCGEQFQTLTIVMGALWCPACPEYLAMLAQQADALTRAGMGFIFMEVENNGRQLASNRESYGYLQGHIPNTPGWRVGDRDTRPSPLIQMSPTVGGFPAAFVVRVRDMMVVADQGATEFVLPYDQIAANPDGNWAQFGGAAGPANCGEDDEEEFEPNNTPNQAGVIGPGDYQGGICDAEGDFYEIDIAGPWRLDLRFTHAQGDLDVYVWNGETNQPVMSADGQSPIGSESYDDLESFTHQGRSLVKVLGFQLNTTTYDLEITAL